jgi:hypothetical protein
MAGVAGEIAAGMQHEWTLESAGSMPHGAVVTIIRIKYFLSPSLDLGQQELALVSRSCSLRADQCLPDGRGPEPAQEKTKKMTVRAAAAAVVVVVRIALTLLIWRIREGSVEVNLGTQEMVEQQGCC